MTYAFDQVRLGRVKDGHMTPDYIARPQGVADEDWAGCATQVCAALNQLAESPQVRRMARAEEVAEAFVEAVTARTQPFPGSPEPFIESNPRPVRMPPALAAPYGGLLGPLKPGDGV